MVFYFNIYLNLIYSCNEKAKFSATIFAVFSVMWFFRNHYMIINFENTCENFDIFSWFFDE